MAQYQIAARQPSSWSRNLARDIARSLIQAAVVGGGLIFLASHFWSLVDL